MCQMLWQVSVTLDLGAVTALAMSGPTISNHIYGSTSGSAMTQLHRFLQWSAALHSHVPMLLLLAAVFWLPPSTNRTSGTGSATAGWLSGLCFPLGSGAAACLRCIPVWLIAHSVYPHHPVLASEHLLKVLQGHLQAGARQRCRAHMGNLNKQHGTNKAAKQGRLLLT